MNSQEAQHIAETVNTMYVALRKSGFEEPQVLCMCSNLIWSLIGQKMIRNEADFKIITGGVK